MSFRILQMSVRQILKQFENIEHVDVLPTVVVVVTDDQKFAITASKVTAIKLEKGPAETEYTLDEFLGALTDWREAVRTIAALLSLGLDKGFTSEKEAAGVPGPPDPPRPEFRTEVG